MSTKQELRDRIDEVTRGRAIWRQGFVVADSVIRDLSDELQATRAELDATRKQRDAAVDAQHVDRAELVEAGDMVAELVDERNAALERVAKLGDIVSDLRARVAELEARVVVEWRDPDVPDRAERDAAWVDAKRWDQAAVTPQPVTLILPDGTSVTFDAVVTR